MIGVVAAFVCIACIAYLFRRERQTTRGESISWAPFAWMFFAGSRFPSGWLQLRGGGGVEAYAEGSPFDRLVFFALLLWGVTVLAKRHLPWQQLAAANKWLVIYFAYCLVSVFWADDSVIVVKRWLKDLGNPIMALILMTERRPYQALSLTARRLAYVLVPISVLFIRYIPEYGRAYAAAGGVMYSGAADQKNTLGLLCFVTVTCYVWAYLLHRQTLRRYDLPIALTALWLLYMSSSKTSLTCLIVASAIIAVGARPALLQRRARIIRITFAVAVIGFVADAVFNLHEVFLGLLGRDSTFTNRTEVWGFVKTLQPNAIVGAGFMSFWSGQRMATIWQVFGPGLNQAHNGYIEQYLNLGYIGVGFVVIVATSALYNIRKHFTQDASGALLRFSFIIAALLYNYTEASFYGINLMWVVFLTMAIHRIEGQTLGEAVRQPQRLQPKLSPRIGLRGANVRLGGATNTALRQRLRTRTSI